MIICSNCGSEQTPLNKECEACGASLIPYTPDNGNLPLESDDPAPQTDGIDTDVKAMPVAAVNADEPAVESIINHQVVDGLTEPDGILSEAGGVISYSEFGAAASVVAVGSASGVLIINEISCGWLRCGRVRAQQEMFTCTQCGKQYCSHHRDRILQSLCRRCARPRELKITIELNAANDAATLILQSDDIDFNDVAWSRTRSLDLATLQTLLDIDRSDPELGVLGPLDVSDSLGDALFNYVIPEEPWVEIADHVRLWSEQRWGMQIRLADIPARLRAWPWEMLRGPDGFLARSQTASVVRWIDANGVAYPTQSALPLSVLVVAGSVERPGELARTEAQALSAGLADLIEEGQLAVEPFVPGDDPVKELRQKLRSDRFQILHLCGSLEITGSPEQTSLELHGLGERLSLTKLIEQFDRSTLQVIVLTATLRYNGTVVSTIDASISLPEQLLTNSIGAILTTRTPLEMSLGREMARVFYESLARDQSLEIALRDAREHLQTVDPTANASAWSLPVLYMRPTDGEGLVLDLDPAEAAPELLSAYQRFVAEDDETVLEEELPSCAIEVLDQVKHHRLQIITGVPDAGLLIVSRYVARQLALEQRALKVLRLPRYEDPGDLLRLLPDLQNAVVLYDAYRLGSIGEELERLARVVIAQTNLYVLISTSDKDTHDARSAVGAWLKQHGEFCTYVRPEHYIDRQFASLRALLRRLLGDARKSALIDLKTEQEVLKYADQPVDGIFSSGYLNLPGQIHRFVFHYLAGSKRVASREKIRLLLEAMDSADDELLRWFGDTLTPSQRVLVLCFTLFQALPTHVLAALYRAIVDRFRMAFHLELAVLPIRAEVQQWRLYFSETHHPQRMSDDRIVEFVDQDHRNQLLHQLRENYGEWLAELVPLLGTVVCGTNDLNGQRRRWNDDDERAVREVIARALGDIAGASPRSLALVADQIRQWMSERWPGVTAPQDRSILQVAAARQIMAIPGNTFRQLLEQSGNVRDHKQVLDIVTDWWRTGDVRVRWSVAAAFRRLAGRIPAARLEPHYRSMIREVQDFRQRASEVLRRPQTSQRGAVGSGAQIGPRGVAGDQQRDAIELTRALAHALRGFANEPDISILRSAVQLLAGDGDLRVRTNTAIALARHAARQPLAVTSLIEEWCREGSWQRWWTGTCVVTLLVEQNRIDQRQSEQLWLRLIDATRVLGRAGEGFSSREAGRYLAWAMGAAADAGEGGRGGSDLDRSLTIIGRLIGVDPRRDDVLLAICQSLLVDDRRTGEVRSQALLAHARAWLTVERYGSQRIRRRMALSLFLNAGQARQRDTYEILRDLLGQEGFTYTELMGRPVEMLPLAHLGVGGMILLAARERLGPGKTEGIELILATVRQLTMINDPHVWTVGPFVLCGIADRAERKLVKAELHAWARGPQVPLQLGAITAAVQLALERSDAYLDDACQALLTVARNARNSKVIERLNERIPEIIDLHNETGRTIISLLDRAAVPQVTL